MTQSHNPVNLLPFGGELLLYDDCFTKEESDYYFNQLLNTLKWEQKQIFVRRWIDQPRLIAFYGDEGKEYPYSRILLKATGWPKVLLSIKTHIEQISGAKFNIALLNLYRDGNDSVSWHRDDEKGMGANPTIASVSFGATRNFKVREYQKKDTRQSLTVPLTHGSMALMRGEMQSVWEHCVPKTSKPVGQRINITFRYVL